MNDSAFLKTSDFLFLTIPLLAGFVFYFNPNHLRLIELSLLVFKPLFNINFYNRGVTFYIGMCLIDRHN